MRVDGTTRLGAAAKGAVVWATNARSRQWTSGGLRGTFTGKDHAYDVQQVRDAARGRVVYGRAVCGTGADYERLDPACGEQHRCKRCEQALARRQETPMLTDLIIDIPDDLWEPVGDDTDPDAVLLSTLRVCGVELHVTAYLIDTQPDGLWLARQQDEVVGLHWAAAEGEGRWELATIRGGEYAIIATPFTT